MATNAEVLFPSRIVGDLKSRHFTAKITVSEARVSTCRKCGGKVLRSWKTGILHRCCRACRELILTYGPSIEVKRIDSKVH